MGIVRIDAQRSRRVGPRSGLDGRIGHSEVGDDDGVCGNFGHGSGDDERRGGEESEDGELHCWSLARVKIRMCDREYDGRGRAVVVGGEQVTMRGTHLLLSWPPEQTPPNTPN